MEKAIIPEKRSQRHQKKFTEGLLNTGVIIKSLNITAGQTIIDAGCGNGYMSKIFSSMVSPSGKVYAMDTNQYFIKIIKSGIEGINIEAIEEDITTTTILRRSSIDLIYISTVVHTFSKQQLDGFLREAKRLLKPDALLAIVEIEKKETSFGPPLRARYSPEELMKIVPWVPKNTVQVGEHFYMQIFINRSN